jgi:uncharacterized protein (DUF983 family)
MSAPQPPDAPARGLAARPAARLRRGTLRWLAAGLWAMLRLRCPRCWQGRLFRGMFAMNDPCPVCGLLFQREEGYFLGAMYFSTALTAVFIGALYLGLSLLLPKWDGMLISALALVLYLPLTPAVFRHSRAMWIWFDRGGSFTDASGGSYEKARERQLAQHRPAPRP